MSFENGPGILFRLNSSLNTDDSESTEPDLPPSNSGEARLKRVFEIIRSALERDSVVMIDHIGHFLICPPQQTDGIMKTIRDAIDVGDDAEKKQSLTDAVGGTWVDGLILSEYLNRDSLPE